MSDKDTRSSGAKGSRSTPGTSDSSSRSGTVDSGYFSRRLPGGLYRSDRTTQDPSEEGLISSRSPLRASIGEQPRSVDEIIRQCSNEAKANRSTYSSPYSSLSSEPSLSRSQYSKLNTDANTTRSNSPYTRSQLRTASPYTSQDGGTSPYIRPASSASYRPDMDRVRSPYQRGDLGDRPASAYPERYSSLGHQRLQPQGDYYGRTPEPYTVGYEAVSLPAGYVPVFYERDPYSEVDGFTSLPYYVELQEGYPVMESPRVRLYSSEAPVPIQPPPRPMSVDYPPARAELERSYSERGYEPQNRGAYSQEQLARGGPSMYGEGIRAERLKQKYGDHRDLRNREPFNYDTGSVNLGRILKNQESLKSDMVTDDTLRSNISDPGVRRMNSNDDRAMQPGVPLPPDKPPPSYEEVIKDKDIGKRFTPMQSQESVSSSLSRSTSQDKGPTRQNSEAYSQSQSSPSNRGSRQNSTGDSQRRPPTETWPKPREYVPSVPTGSNSRGNSFDEDQGPFQRVRFGGFFDDFDRPSLFGRRGRGFFDAFDMDDERERRRARFRDLFDDKLSLFGRHRSLFDDFDPFDRSGSGSPIYRSHSGSPSNKMRSSKSPSPGTKGSRSSSRADSPRVNKTTTIITEDPKDGKKVVTISELSSPKTGKKKHVITETKTSSIDADDGTRRTLTETKTETIDEPDEKGNENTEETEKKSWKPVDDRNLFDKYKFKFGSIGNFGSGKSTGRETLHFKDFDDLVNKFKKLHQKSAADIKEEELKNEDIREEQENKDSEQENKKVDKDEKNEQIKGETKDIVLELDKVTGGIDVGGTDNTPSGKKYD